MNGVVQFIKNVFFLTIALGIAGTLVVTHLSEFYMAEQAVDYY